MKTARRLKKIVGQVKTKSKTSERKKRSLDVRKLVPTPSVTFNLECSGRYEGAFYTGKVVNLIGDSHSGKTLFALSIYAECSLLPQFDEYRFIYDDVELANEFDIEYLFGTECAERIKKDEKRSSTIEEFGDNFARAIEDGRPFIYVLDSFDALTSESALELSDDNRKKREKGQKTSGSYGDGKPKAMSQFFKDRNQGLKGTDALLIVISQTRDNLGFGAMFNPKTRSGGKALKFYSCHEVWLAMQKREKKGKRTFITNVQAKITKNKLTGNHGEAFFPIMYDYGVDNIASCIKFMIEEGDWTKSGQTINTQGFHPDGKLTFAKLVSWIEDKEKENDLALCCQDAYDAIMEALKPNRKRKY